MLAPSQLLTVFKKPLTTAQNDVPTQSEIINHSNIEEVLMVKEAVEEHQKSSSSFSSDEENEEDFQKINKHDFSDDSNHY